MPEQRGEGSGRWEPSCRRNNAKQSSLVIIINVILVNVIIVIVVIELQSKEVFFQESAI